MSTRHSTLTALVMPNAPAAQRESAVIAVAGLPPLAPPRSAAPPAPDAARALIIAEAARSWPTATALVLLYEASGPTPRVWRLLRVLGADGSVLHEWEDAACSAGGDPDRSAVALDLLLAGAAPRSLGLPAPCASTELMLHRLVL